MTVESEKPNVTILLKEYDAIRGEMLDRQRTRFTILGLTLTATGVGLGALANRIDSPLTDNDLLFALGTVIYVLFLIVIAEVLTIHQSEAIYKAGAYIRTYFESEIQELNWETRMQRLEAQLPGKHHRTSWALGVFYLSLTGISLLTLLLLLPMPSGTAIYQFVSSAQLPLLPWHLLLLINDHLKACLLGSIVLILAGLSVRFTAYLRKGIAKQQQLVWKKELLRKNA